jgi:GT2 family glycosyltransferase
MKTSIVILNYNGINFLKKYLPGIIKYSEYPDVEIVVADNSSTDNSVDFVKENFPTIKLIINSDNFGFAGGYNRALQNVKSDYYVLVNSDIEVTKDWLNPMIEYMDEHPEVSACQPKILSFNQKNMFEHAGAAGGFIDSLGYPFCRGRILGECENDSKQYDSVIEIFWASGACLFIRRNDFWEVGGFDESFFAHMEEIDLCWRLNARGKKLVCIPASVVYHVGGGTLSTENPQKTYLNYRNNLLMIYKNMDKKSLQLVMIIRMFLDYLAALQLFLSGKKANARSILKARRDFKDRKLVYKNRREENIRLTIEKSPKTIFKGSIIYQYYIRSRKFYSELKFK